jgi:hypothetical protein
MSTCAHCAVCAAFPPNRLYGRFLTPNRKTRAKTAKWAQFSIRERAYLRIMATYRKRCAMCAMCATTMETFSDLPKHTISFIINQLRGSFYSLHHKGYSDRVEFSLRDVPT